jgi:heterodisulfide reductase subunit A2
MDLEPTMEIDNNGRLSEVRTGVVICDCGENISGVIDTQALCRRAAEIPEVAVAWREAYPCSKDGLTRLRQAVKEHQLDRVLVAGCSPRLMLNHFREAAGAAGLNPNELNIANIREQCAYLHGDSPSAALDKAAGLVEMAVARLAVSGPVPSRSGRVIKAVLVAGSHLSSLTLALNLADAGYRVYLVESTDSLGQFAPGDLQRLTLQLTLEKAQQALTHPLVEVMFNSRILEVAGHPGEYEILLQQGDRDLRIPVGAVVAANAARPKDLGSAQWFDRSRVRTQAEFESELEAALGGREPLALNNIVFILCAEPSQRENCSRVCCNIAIRQARLARQLNPRSNITVLFRDLYMGGIGGAYENELQEARKSGVTFFRYRKERPPVIGSQTVDILDTLTGEPVRVPFDRVILSMPMVPQDNMPQLAAILGLPLDDSGFLAEPRLRLRPGRYAERGIFALGSAQQPADADEALFQAYLAAARVAHFLEKDSIEVTTPSAWIDPALCTGCGNCPRVCPASAIHLEKTDGVLSRSEVDSLRCFGCGNCVVVCPAKAITLPGWDNIEIPVQIQTALQSPGFQKDLPRVIVLACEWSAYAAADMVGSRYKASGSPALQVSANVRVIRMNCSARFDPYHILWAFLNGADGVFLGACPPGECHYGSGNLYAQERVELLKKNLEQHGINPSRLHLEFLSVEDGPRFAASLAGFVKGISEKHRNGIRERELSL